MAELGQYWREGESSVACPQYVIEYLRASRPKSVREIVAEDGAPGSAPARTGDSWQNYAWRWALCHMLDANPNYSARFRPLGLAYLTGAPASFAETFGPMLGEIEFEYRQFLAHVGPGYRVDLCRWDWNRTFREPTVDSPIRARVAAARGWQPSGALVHRGRNYNYSAKGTWQIGPGRDRVAADGLADGAGRLEGVIFHDYKLGEPFALSARGTLAPPADGQLFVRCRDQWNGLADNSGSMAFAIRAATAGGSRPGPLGADVLETPGPADAR
jgi:hypothetical protein